MDVIILIINVEEIMNNNKNKSLKIQTLCLVTTFAFFAGECFCGEVFGGVGSEAGLPKKYDLGYKEDKNIIKNAQKRIYDIENAITGDPFQRSEYIRVHRSEINKNKNLIELAKNLTDSKKRYNELMNKLSKPSINNTEKQRLLDNLSGVVNELAERVNYLIQKVPNYKPDSPKVSNFDKFSAWLNQFFTKKSIGAGNSYLLKKMKEGQAPDNDESKRSENTSKNDYNKTSTWEDKNELDKFEEAVYEYQENLANSTKEKQNENNNSKNDYNETSTWEDEPEINRLDREIEIISEANQSGENSSAENNSESDDDKNNQQSKGSSTNNDSKSGNGEDKQSEDDSSKGNNSESSNSEDKQSEDDSESDDNGNNQQSGEDSSTEDNSKSDNGEDKQSEDDSTEDGNKNNQQSEDSSTGDNSGSSSSEDLSEENSTIFNNVSTEEKASLKLPKEDNIKKVFTPEEVISDVISMISTPTTNIISERLSSDNSVIAAGSNTNLVASTDNRSINLGNNDDSYEVWSKIHYNYSSNSSRSIHIFGLTLGGEYSFKNNKYKIGLAYTFNSGNGSKYISNSISLYSSISDINIRNFRNNFANVILTYGRLNTNIVKNENKLVAIKHGYSTDLISLNTIFGHNIVLPNSNGTVTPTMGIRYDYINRNTYTNNALKHGELSMNIITPTAGVSYINKVLNDNLTIKVGVNLGYGFNLNNKTNIILKTTNNSHSETIGYTSTNALTSNFNFGLAYKVKKNIELSFDSNISYGINETFNTGFSFGGRYQF